jgi:putative transcriptional regulator
MTNSLRELRGTRGWSQGELAKQLGVSRQTVNAIETGKYDPSLPLAFGIAQLFALTIEEVFQPSGSSSEVAPPAVRAQDRDFID